MDAKTFLGKKPKAEVERVAKAAGTNLAYFKQIAYGCRTPSAKLAEALERASNGAMKRMELLYPRAAPIRKSPAATQSAGKSA